MTRNQTIASVGAAAIIVGALMIQPAPEPADPLPPLPGVMADDPETYGSAAPLLITNRISFDTQLTVTGGLTRFIVVQSWPDGREVARQGVPEPRGQVPIYKPTATGWTVSGYSNIVQDFHIRFTHIGASGFFAVTSE